MKRFVLTISALLFGLAVRAQVATYTCRYWFDENHAQAVTTTFGASGWEAELDVGDLTDGLHALHLHVLAADTVSVLGIENDSLYHASDTVIMKWSAPQTYLFLKTGTWDNGASNYNYHCWFDEDFTNQQSDALGSGHLLLNVAELEEGMHTVHVLVEGTTYTSTQSYMFMKVAPFEADTMDMSHLVYHCWFDEDFEHHVTDSLGNGNLLLDVGDLEDGLHTVHVMLEGSTLTATQSYMFMKMAVQDPTTELQYICWFDQDYSNVQTGLVGSGLVELEASTLPNGIHTVNVQLDNGSLTSPQTYLFYKQPLGGYGVARWEYWVNDNWDDRNTTVLPASVDTLEIISLLPVGHPDVRSSCFHFHPNGEEPYINAKNKISFLIWDAEMRFMDMTSFYVDEHVRQDVVAHVFERNTTETFAAPRDNQITWYKLDAVVGDSLAFVADKACTMQLFAPSGEEVYSATASETMVFGGCHAWEDGTYYLAVHDVTGSGETISVTYNWVYRYAILAYDVHLVGNGGCSTINFNGNGFNSLLDVYLVNAQNDTIRRIDYVFESNTTIPIMFNFNEVCLGMYDIVFVFYDEEIRINNALEVQEPVDITLSSSVSSSGAFARGGTITYSFTVTNHGNMTAYAVPIYVYISTPKYNTLTHIEIDGFRLPSILDYFNVNWDSILIIENVIDLRNRSKEIGDDHNFYRQSVPNGNGGYKAVRSNYFFVDIAPNESKRIKLRMTHSYSSESVEVWMTAPNHIISPYQPSGNGGGQGGNGGQGVGGGSSNPYCCVYEQIQCTVDVICDGIDLFNLGSDVSDCICGLLSNGNDFISRIVCEGESPSNAWKDLNKKSVVGTALSCVKSVNPFQKLKMILDIADGLMEIWDLKDWMDNPNQPGYGTQVEDCISTWQKKKPDCPPGDPVGGWSHLYVPRDPNDIHGYLSESGSHYMRQEIQNVQYEIEFENDTTLATAAAHTIIVRDTLDATKFDLNSLAARSVTIGDKRLDLNGEQTFARTLDMRPELYVIAQVEQDYDPATGIIQWTIQSLDPMTMEPTDDPNQGVLPVNYFGDGVGFIDYSIDIKEAFVDGTEISNRAGIIFDQEEVIMTPVWTNTVDAVKPISQIEEVTPVADSLSFSFVSEDNRSGVWYHVLYHRNDSTEMQWQVWKPQIIGNDFKLLPELLTTEYLVIAVDSAGNREEKEMVAEYTYYYEGPGPASQTNSLTQGWNWWSTYVEMNNVDGLGMLQNSLGHNGLTIKSQNDFTDNYFLDMGEDYWYGSLESIQNEQGYLINVADACNVTLTGSAAIPALHPITIQPNWNWIGYPVAVPQTVANALVGFNPMPDDVVKGQSDFASYYEGFGWYPDDFMLVPGQSYLYFSNANVNKTLTYANGSRGGALKSRKLGITYWNNNVHAYADNLSVMAVVTVDSIEQRDENLELGAFVNGECRGSVRLRHFAPLDRYYAMLTVSGQDGDLVEFRLIQTESFEANESCGNHLVFKKDAIVGSLGHPYEIRFGDAIDMSSSMTLYPNPVACGENFSLIVPLGETIAEVVITDVLGNQLRHETGAVNVRSVKGLPIAGVYLIKAVAKSGNTYHGRLIVE